MMQHLVGPTGLWEKLTIRYGAGAGNRFSVCGDTDRWLQSRAGRRRADIVR